MFDKKYYPGDPCSFHFQSAKLKKYGSESVIVFETTHIKHVKATIEDKFGNFPSYENYSGKVFMKEQLIRDWGFHDIQKRISFTKQTKKIRLPQTGFYSEHGKTNLHLDIDTKGKVWLTDRTFYELSLYKKLEDLKQKQKEIKEQIAELLEEIEEFDLGVMHDIMDKDRQNVVENAKDSYYSSMQNDIVSDEERTMDNETDGFWRWNID